MTDKATGGGILLSIDALKGNKVILATPMGLIFGTLCEENVTDNPDAGQNILATLCEKVVEDYELDKISGNDGFMLLTDASIKATGTTINVGSIIVFYDQIIGVSLGNIG